MEYLTYKTTTAVTKSMNDLTGGNLHKCSHQIMRFDFIY